jgi:hypothetical protein
MHEGDHSILGDEHDHDHHAHTRGPHEQAHSHERTGPRSTSRLIAGVVVAAAVVLFIVWRFV